MKSKIKCKFSKKIWRLKEEFKTSNRRNDTNQVVTIEVIIKKNNKGATSKKALILFFLSAFLRLTSKGIPSVVKI